MDAWMTSQVAPRGFDKDNIKDPPVTPFSCLVSSSPGNQIWAIRVRTVGDLLTVYWSEEQREGGWQWHEICCYSVFISHLPPTTHKPPQKTCAHTHTHTHCPPFLHRFLPAFSFLCALFKSVRRHWREKGRLEGKWRERQKEESESTEG